MLKVIERYGHYPSVAKINDSLSTYVLFEFREARTEEINPVQ